MLPGREQLVCLWQALVRLMDGSGSFCGARLPTLRRLAGSVGGAEPFLRTLVGLLVFAERDLLTLEAEGDALTIALQAHKKVNLAESPYICRLHQVLGLQEKGGV